MKKIDRDTLFTIFEIGDEEVYNENGVSDILYDSTVLFNMAVRGVENYYLMEQMYTNKYGESFTSVKESIKLKYFIGLLRYLERIDLSQAETLYQLKDVFGEQSIHYALREMIDFFEKLEMYEYCAILFKFYKVFFPKNSWKLVD